MANVELRGVSKAFGSTPVLQDVELDIRSGEFVVFVGPSGCGFSKRFGLIHVNFSDQTRTIKDSGRLYSEVIKTNGAVLQASEPIRA